MADSDSAEKQPVERTDQAEAVPLEQESEDLAGWTRSTVHGPMLVRCQTNLLLDLSRHYDSPAMASPDSVELCQTPWVPVNLARNRKAEAGVD